MDGPKANTREVMVQEGGLYSNHSDNPLADYWHVIVPYCSSDTWAGTGRSLETGYYFHGKHVFRSLSLHGPALTVIAGTSSTASVTTTTSSQPRTSSCQESIPCDGHWKLS